MCVKASGPTGSTLELPGWLPPVPLTYYFSRGITTLGSYMILSKTFSPTILNYLLLAIEVSFQCGASEIKVLS